VFINVEEYFCKAKTLKILYQGWQDKPLGHFWLSSRKNCTVLSLHVGKLYIKLRPLSYHTSTVWSSMAWNNNKNKTICISPNYCKE